MSNLVFVSGGFSSGSTLVFTLFRKTGEYHCLYEPLHERLPLYRIAGLPVYDRHYHVDDYFSEYRDFDRLPELFDPAWGTRRLHLRAGDEADELYRYLSYIVGRSFECRPRVLLQFNRATFRLGWLRANFPRARIVHIWRECRAQWRSLVRRVQQHHGKEDVGHRHPDFTGFNLAAWCDDLAGHFPELAEERSRTGYERFSKLWRLSRRESERYADISICLSDLKEDFPATFESVRDAVGGSFPVPPLERYVVSGEASEGQKEALPGRRRLRRLSHRARLRLARIYLKLRYPASDSLR